MYWKGVLVREPRVCIRSRGSVFLALRPSTRPNKDRTRNRTGVTSQILGTPRCYEPRTAVARPGQGSAIARTACRSTTVHEEFDTRDMKEAKVLLDELRIIEKS